MKPIYEGLRQIRFEEVDPAGILFFAKAFHLAHEALEVLLTSSPQGWDYWFNNPEWAVPIRSAQSEYYSPVHAGKTYLTRLSVEQPNDSSLNFQFELFNTDSDNKRSLLQVRTTHVFVDKKTFQRRSIPEPILQFFKN